MAFLDDEDEAMQRLGLAPAPAMASPSAPAPMAGGVPAPTQQPQAPAAQAGTGHVNLDRYLGANQAGGKQMAERIAGGIESDAQGVQRDALQAMQDPQWNALQQRAGGVAERARLAGGQGVGTLLANEYGRGGGYSSGMQGFDAFLAGNAGGNRLQDVSSRYGALDRQLQRRQPVAAPVDARPAPGVGASGRGGTGGGAGPGVVAPSPPASRASTGNDPDGLGSDPWRRRRMLN